MEFVPFLVIQVACNISLEQQVVLQVSILIRVPLPYLHIYLVKSKTAIKYLDNQDVSKAKVR